MPYLVPLVRLHGLLQLYSAEVCGQHQCRTAVLYDVLLHGRLVLLQGRAEAALQSMAVLGAAAAVHFYD